MAFSDVCVCEWRILGRAQLRGRGRCWEVCPGTRPRLVRARNYVCVWEKKLPCPLLSWGFLLCLLLHLSAGLELELLSPTTGQSLVGGAHCS